MLDKPEMSKAYEPGEHEDKIYTAWLESGFFNPDNLPGERKESFSMVLPPPNVTGVLHLGHAAMLAVEDAMTRFARMSGKRALWVPGTDHAAIATQTKVEKLLIKDGIEDPRRTLGREEFLNRVKKFASESHDTIVHQVKKMGASLDWSREAYTLDEDRNKAVNTVFKMMYEDGLIYRGHRVINWCPRCKSTLADDETVYREEKGKFYWIKYGPFVLATSRPETKLGDTAVAVHPTDERYKDMVGKKFMIPGVLGEFEITVVADEAVDPNFGTGAVKVTPFHSSVDFDIAQRHEIGGKQIINEDGRMMDNCGKYAGLTTLEAREAIVADMQKMGLIDHIDEDYVHSLALCYRCETVIEPLPKLQWFIGVNRPFKFHSSAHTPIEGIVEGQEVTLKQLMQHVVRTNQIKIMPEQFVNTYFHWIDNLRDWNISRQIWFGHQVPGWYKQASQPVQITFLRHGESQANLDKVGAGHLDSPLTEKGREDARELGKKIDSKLYDIVYSSDLVRASETAEIVFGDVHKEVTLDKRLREINFGDIAGKSDEEVNKYRISGFPNGENYFQVRDRVISFLSEIIDKHPGQRVAIAAHSGIWKVLENIVHGVKFDQEHLKIHATREPVDYEVSDLFFVGMEAPVGNNWLQDPDTLDTWFSSGLWTFSTLGWPDKTKDFEMYHPNTIMETGYDILFFWVARMILMTTYAIGEVPFKNVYLHGLVRDEHGKKMSKSLGNAIDPLLAIEKYGADATRLSLVIGTSPGNDMKMSEEKIAGFRNFTNKLWNISRYVLSTVEFRGEGKGDRDGSSIVESVTLADKWIVGRLSEVVQKVTGHLEKYEFSQAGELLRDFTWSDFADWYLEISKIQKKQPELVASTDAVLLFVLENLLKLWHPFMPFVTETIWEQMGKESLLIVEPWPSLKQIVDEKVTKDFSALQEIVVAIRNLRSENKVEPVKLVAVSFTTNEKEILIEQAEIIKTLARVSEISFVDAKPEDSVSCVIGQTSIHLSLVGLVDKEKEKDRLTKELENVEKYLVTLEKQLSNEEFVAKAPAKVIEGLKQKQDEANKKSVGLKQQLENL